MRSKTLDILTPVRVLTSLKFQDTTLKSLQNSHDHQQEVSVIRSTNKVKFLNSFPIIVGYV